MKLYSWNVNGIRAVWKKGAFQSFIENEKPDIICLQEIKATREQTEVELPGYFEYWNPALKKGYSGTALFTRIEPLTIIYGFNEKLIKKYNMSGDLYGDPNAEGRVITAEYHTFFVVTVYTPNAKDDLSRIPLREKHWDPAFLEHCQQLEKIKPVIFCGDLNVAHTEDDLANPKQNMGKKGFTDEERRGFQNFISAGFVDTLREFHAGNGLYTWWSFWASARSRNIGWRIDYILLSNALRKKLTAAAIHPQQLGSDHCPVSIDIDI
ncbi:MAG: exodeoxyribonuclease III [Candidatus Saccharimonadales bacterium]